LNIASDHDSEDSLTEEDDNIDLPSMLVEPPAYVRREIETIEGGGISFSTSQRPSVRRTSTALSRLSSSIPSDRSSVHYASASTMSTLASSSSLPSTASHIENSTQENTNPPFLWGDVTRRPKHKATGENQSLMVLVRHIILAEIFTGRASQQFSSVLWPDLHDELALNRLIGDIWRERRAVRSEENTRVGYGLLPTELPIPAEARQLRDSIGEWRSHSIMKIRSLVAGHYQLESSSSKNAELVEKLLHGYNFICQDYRKPDKLRFLASIIIKSIGETFFGKKRHGTGLYDASWEYFRPLPDTIVIISCTQIYHAISEYSSGQRKAARFEGDEMELVYKTLHVAWHEQSSERRKRILTMLFNRIQDYMGLNKQEHNPRHIISIPNPYKDRTDDLDELEAEQEASEGETE